MTQYILSLRNFTSSSKVVVRIPSALLPPFQVSVLKWIGDSGLQPEQFTLRCISLVINDVTKKIRKIV